MYSVNKKPPISRRCGFRCVALTAAVGLFLAGAFIVTFVFRREKFVNGKSDFSEGFARVVGIAVAFLTGYAEVVCRNEHLNVSFKLNDCENTERNGNCLVVMAAEKVLGEFLGKRSFNAFRQRYVGIAEGAAAVARAAELCVKGDRLGNLYLCTWICVCGNKLVVVRICGVFRRIDLNCTVAAVEYAFLRERRKTVYCNRRKAACRISLNGNLEEKCNVNRVAALVKRHFFNVDKTVDYACASQFYIYAVVYYVLRLVGKINSEVGKAILVCARVVNTVCVNANCFSDFAGNIVTATSLIL